jgi:hypothetical protein
LPNTLNFSVIALLALGMAVFLSVVARVWLQRWRVRKWVKSLTAARVARRERNFAEADRLLETALNAAKSLSRYWKIKAATCGEYAALLGAEGKFGEAEKYLRENWRYGDFGPPRAPETVGYLPTGQMLDMRGNGGAATPACRGRRYKKYRC